MEGLDLGDCVENLEIVNAVPPIRSEFSDFGPNSDFFEPNSPNLVYIWQKKSDLGLISAKLGLI